MSEFVTLNRDGDVAVIVIDNPPVNALSQPVVNRLGEQVAAFEADRSLKALVICGAGRSFIAGGDLAEFDQPGFSAAPYNRVLARIEALDRPVVAVLHGHALGGGLELALACHYRLPCPAPDLAFPRCRSACFPAR